jgi:cardiolipin synthase
MGHFELDVSVWHVLLSAATAVGYVLTLCLLPVVWLQKKRSPTSTVAWIMAIVMMPCFGGVLYLLFGIERIQRRMRGRQAASAQLTSSLPDLALHHLAAHDGLSSMQQSLVRLAERVAGVPVTAGNRVELFAETTAAFAALQAALETAERSIHLEYYIWQPDRIGTKLRNLLISKARNGVAVRFLYDSLGSMRLTQKFLQPMRDAGIQIATFVPGQSFRERWSINLRSHRKIVVIDGETGFTGGMNVGDEYLGRNPHFGYWRDTHLRLDGPTVLQLQEVFATDWFYATGEELNGPEFFPSPAEVGKVNAQVLASGPDDPDAIFHTVMFAAINQAQKQVLVSTSYFVPPPALFSALEAAALRGVRTRVLVSGPVTYWTTYHACRSFYDELLRAGVEIYEYHRGQQHAKTLTVDGEWSIVGTPNFDARSVFLNFEVAVALYDAGIAEQLEDHFEADLGGAMKIDPAVWARRSVWERIKENGCRMFAPVL